MDSTMIYQLIHQQINKPKELIHLIPTFASFIAPGSKITIDRMNDQQIFSQVYKTLNSVLAAKESLKNQIFSQVKFEDEAQEQIQQDSEDINDQQMPEKEQNEMEGEMQDNEQGHEEEQQMEDQENDGQLQEIDELGDQQAYDGQQDIGLYGQQIDEEELQSYENQGNSQQDKQFQEQQKFVSKKFKKNKQQQEQQGGQDDLINDQFNHFREIQLQNNDLENNNNSLQKTDLQKQIEKLQNKIIAKKDWALKGQVKGSQRPVNSLLQYDLQFKTGIKLTQQITPQYNEDLQKIIKQRILDDLYDDRVRYQHTNVLRQHYGSLKEVSRQKSKQGLSELYQSQFKNYLGLGQNKQDKLKMDIMQSFKEVNYFLDSLSNFHFTPRVKSSNKTEAAIVEEKVPVMGWKGNATEEPSKLKKKFKSQKQQDNKGKRLKNKRIERQRRKQITRKKLNKKIQYGGMTKFQAKTIQKRAKNNLNQNKIKYNKSANFFNEMNKDKNKKPNPNISKMKI